MLQLQFSFFLLLQYCAYSLFRFRRKKSLKNNITCWLKIPALSASETAGNCSETSLKISGSVMFANVEMLWSRVKYIQ